MSSNMATNRIHEGIELCKEILQDAESHRPNLMGLFKKIRRLAYLLDKANDDDFSWFIEKEREYSTPSGFGFGGGILIQAYDSMVNCIHLFITNQWIELQFGGIIENIFEDTKKLVDSKLVKTCPEAVEKFTSAYDRLRGTNPEEWAQAVTTCRRILKDFADAIYPPTNNISNGRNLNNEHYINRLWAFASEKIDSSTNKDLIQSEVEYIGNRIDSLYSLACKGTHDKISKHEADQAIIRTYLLIGDLIKLGDL